MKLNGADIFLLVQMQTFCMYSMIPTIKSK